MNDFGYRLIDLSYDLVPETPHWTGRCGFEHKIEVDYKDVGCRAFRVKMFAGIGTHIDAPAHFVPGAKTVDQLPLDRLLAKCFVISVQEKMKPDLSVESSDVQEFEQTHGKISKGGFVLFYTGWSKYWSEPDKYRNDLVFPALSEDCVELLIDRGVAGVGIDTLSPDRPDSGFVAHHKFFSKDIYIVENVANADKLPPVGAYTLVAPLKMVGGTESTARLIGMVREI